MTLTIQDIERAAQSIVENTGRPEQYYLPMNFIDWHRKSYFLDILERLVRTHA